MVCDARRYEGYLREKLEEAEELARINGGEIEGWLYLLVNPFEWRYNRGMITMRWPMPRYTVECRIRLDTKSIECICIKGAGGDNDRLRDTGFPEYCSYTNTAPPICTINSIVELNENMRELLHKALITGTASAGIITVYRKDYDRYSARFEIIIHKRSAKKNYTMVADIPITMIVGDEESK